MSLPEATYDMTELAMGGNQNRYQADAVLSVKFFTHPKLNQGLSDTMQRPMYDETDYVQIMQPGNKESIVRRPATDMDKKRFAEHFKKYKARQTQDFGEGTPLEQWPQITRSQVLEMKWFNINTVEQLVDMTDANAQNIMGIGALQEKGRKFLLVAAGDKDAAALEAKLGQKQEQIDALMARLDALEDAGEPIEEVPDLTDVPDEAPADTHRKSRRRKKAE